MKIFENGKLFGFVFVDDIVFVVEVVGGLKLDKCIVVLFKGLVKKIGNYQVEFKLYVDVFGKVNFLVVVV